MALEFNGLSYAVMMATGTDLEDFARGFALTEGLAHSAADVLDIDVAEVDNGIVVRTNVSGLGIDKLTERVRTRVAESSCGLCGIENLEALSRPLPQVAAHQAVAPSAIFAALADLRDHQTLNRRTGAAHAAALADRAGRLLCVREDVGRHNAVDKLIGAATSSSLDLGAGFIISSARCSYEIAEKVVLVGGTTLVTISLPTTFAVEKAAAAGLSLFCLAREDSVLQIVEGRIVDPPPIHSNS